MTRTKLAEAIEDLDILSGGAIVIGMSYQLNWIYVTASKRGRLVRRRYRYGQSVEVFTDA